MSASKRKMPLARLLVERGLFEQEDEAKRWIMAGKVLVHGRLLDKPGMSVAHDAQVEVRGRAGYASRAGYKLEAALDFFALSVGDQVALKPRHGIHEFFVAFIRRLDIPEWYFDKETLLAIVEGEGVGKSEAE